MIHKNRKLLSLLMILCMVFTLLPFNNMRVLASDTGVDNSEERISEASAVSGTAITMTSSEDEVFYDLWVGGVQVTSANKDNITGVGIKSVADTDGKVSYDPEQNILTLNNVIITVYSSLNGFYANIWKLLQS